MRGHLTVPEHEWKTGDPWFSARSNRVSSMSDNRDATCRDHTKVRPARLTAITEGHPTGIRSAGHGTSLQNYEYAQLPGVGPDDLERKD